MVRFMSFSSGSCGNCYYLSSDGPEGHKGLLVDAGVSLRRMKAVLLSRGLDFNAFSDVLVTHDHLDHIRHLGALCKRLGKPVHAMPELHRALAYHTFTAPYISGCRQDLVEGEWNEVAGAHVRYFEVPHDATRTVGYAILLDGHKFVIMTDIGSMTEEALRFASLADTVVIESNYDMDMLMGGPYPHELKMRICTGNGHLSNDACAAAIRRFYHDGLRNLFLCHLSENNNTPDLALASARRALDELGVPAGEVQLRALPRQVPSPLFIL